MSSVEEKIEKLNARTEDLPIHAQWPKAKNRQNSSCFVSCAEYDEQNSTQNTLELKEHNICRCVIFTTTLFLLFVVLLTMMIT